MSKNYFHAIATMIGTIVGVGMFSVPFVVYKSGIILFFGFIIVFGFIQYYMHLIYAEIFLSSKKRHRVPGYVEEYLGPRYKKPALVVVLISTNLTILSYFIIGGIFFHQLLSPAFGGTVFFYSFLMFLLAGVLTFKGVKFIAKTELVMSSIFFFVIAVIIFKGFPHISMDNYQSIDWSNFFLPYGPVFMAVSGMTAIPTVCTLLAHKKENIRSAIRWGTIVPIIITILFVLSVVGVSGSLTSQDSLVGLSNALGGPVLLLALVFGLVSIITSLIMFVEATKEIYWWDMGMNKMESWAISLFIPFILFLLGINNLTSVVSLSGAVIGGIISILYIFLILRVKKQPQKDSIIKVRINDKIAFGLIVLFVLGFITVLDYVGIKTVAIIAFVMTFYLYSLISSDKKNTNIYNELIETAKKASLIFLFIFLLALSFGVFSVIV